MSKTDTPPKEIPNRWKIFLTDYVASDNKAGVETDVDRLHSIIKDQAKVSPLSLAKAGSNLWGPTLAKWGITDPEDVIRIVDGLRDIQSAAPINVPKSPLTPQALQAMMLSGFEGCNLRDNRANKPQHHLAANTAQFQTIGRQEALQRTFSVMQDRINNKSAHSAYNPLIATHAPPGGGKSTFLDLVLSRSDEVLQQSSPQMAQILKNSVPITVTYNSQTPYQSFIKADNLPEFSLCCRMLYSYYYTYDSDFNKFLVWMQHYAQVLTLDGVVGCIRLDAGDKPILLGLDEVVSAFGKEVVDTNKVAQIVSKVGWCLNKYGSQFNAIVTTLDTVAVNAETTMSGRPIAWIPLPRLTTKQSFELFQQELVDPSTPSYFRTAIGACGGHARTLESLKTFYAKNKTTCCALEFQQFLLVFCEHLLSVNTLKLTLPLVLCALRNEPVALDFKPINSAYSIRQYIRDGYYINNLVGTEVYVIPIVSPLGLLHFARQVEFTTAAVEKKLSVCLTSMIQINPTHWQDYEKFHANWEAVARLVVMEEKEVSFHEWYHQPKLCNTTLSFNLATEMKSVAVVDMVGDLPARQDRNQQVFLMDFTKNNPGFDIAIFERDVVVAIECRFSKPNASTILSLSEVQEKRKLATEAITQFFGAGTRVLLVVAAYRNVANFQKEKLPADTIVLSRKKLNTIYSPSLMPIFDIFFHIN